MSVKRINHDHSFLLRIISNDLTDDDKRLLCAIYIDYADSERTARMIAQDPTSEETALAMADDGYITLLEKFVKKHLKG